MSALAVASADVSAATGLIVVSAMHRDRCVNVRQLCGGPDNGSGSDSSSLLAGECGARDIGAGGRSAIASVAVLATLRALCIRLMQGEGWYADAPLSCGIGSWVAVTAVAASLKTVVPMMDV